MFDVLQTQQKLYKQVKTELFCNAFYLQNKEKKCFLNQSCNLMWQVDECHHHFVSLQEENKMSCLKARSFWQSKD